MEIKRTLDDPYFLEKSRYLGNCYILQDQNQIYHYEFILNHNEAKILSDTTLYFSEVIEYFRKDNAFITIFKTEDGSFYRAYDSVPTFKLPISILQVSTLFLNQKRIQELRNYYNPDTTTIPVVIIQDEYVILDGNHRLFLAYEAGCKMVSAYLAEKNSITEDFLYLAKEQNIKQIGDVKLLSDAEYKSMWLPFTESFSKY